VALVWWRGIELTWSWGGGGGKLDSGRTLPKGKPRDYATSVSAGRRGGGGGPNISEGGNPGSTPPAYKLVGRGGEVEGGRGCTYSFGVGEGGGEGDPKRWRGEPKTSEVTRR